MAIIISLILWSLLTPAREAVYAATYETTYEKLTGHDWRKYNSANKVYYMMGFLEGNTLGRLQEANDDMARALAWAISNLCNDKKKDACDGVMRLIADKGQELEQLADEKKPIRLNKPLGYFISELDAFYEAFPLCRGRSLAFTLAQLVNVWAGGGQTSYEKVGANCGK